MEFVFLVSLPTACSLLFKFKNLSPKLFEFKPWLKKLRAFLTLVLLLGFSPG